ncbi:MAG: PaaI family thioesterase [Acidobacteria bacterium]|nr:PaaI family thioesterase [Acidobacteriota bacterium]
MSDRQLARLRDALARVPFARLLGIEIVSLAPGEATMRMRARPELMRMEGIMHGGALASLMDSASAFAVLTTLEEGERTVTIDLTIHYLRPVSGGSVEARATVLRAGRRVVTVSIEATSEPGKTVATALTTYLKTA